MALVKFRKLTRASFDLIGNKDNDTRYTVLEPDGTITEYIGDTQISGNSKPDIFYGTTSGTNTAYTLTIDGISEYYNGLMVVVKFHVASGASASININSIGTRALLYNNANTTTSSISANDVLLIVYDATAGNFKCSADKNTTYTNMTASHIATGTSTTGMRISPKVLKDELNKKVDKVSGKGLSTEDYTTAEKTKLAGIEVGAEANVQSDWNVTDPSSDAFIKNKPAIPPAVTVINNLTSTSTTAALAAAQGKILKEGLDGKANLSGANFTGNINTTSITNTYYAQNVLRFGTTSTPVQTVIYTKIKYQSGAHMPVLRIYGYAYGLNSPVELKIGFYIYGGNLGWSGAVSMGAWRPEVFLFKYNEGGADYVGVGLKGSVYYLAFQVDVQTVNIGSIGNSILIDGWSSAFRTQAQVDASDTIIPSIGVDNCIQVPYKSTLSSLNLQFNGATQTVYDGATTKTLNITPSAIGLGLVQNYAIASQAQAEAGTINTAYMTPLRTAQAIAALAPAPTTVVDNLTSTSTTSALSANQGKILKDLVDTKVDKVSGKGLSTNDYTTAEKNKLAGIAAGAEVNVQADWNETNSSSDAFIKNKPTIPSVVNNLTSTSITAALSANQGRILKNSLDTKVDKVANKGLSTEDYTTAEKNKLASIAAGAEANVQSDWNETDPGSAAFIKNKPTTIPTYEDLTILPGIWKEIKSRTDTGSLTAVSTNAAAITGTVDRYHTYKMEISNLESGYTNPKIIEFTLANSSDSTTSNITFTEWNGTDEKTTAISPYYTATPNNDIRSIATDDMYIYVGGTAKTVRKYLKSDFSYAGETPSYGGVVNSVVVDDMYVYVGGSTTRTVKKYLKSTLAYVGETPSYGGDILSIAIDDIYIYVGGYTAQRVRKYLKSDLSYVGEAPSYGGIIYSIAVDDTHVYVGGGTTNTVRKYLKSNLSYIGETSSYGGTIRSIAIDDTHIYAGGHTVFTVKKYLKSNLSYIGETPSYGNTITSIAIDDTHIYAGGFTTIRVRKYLKSDLTYIGETTSYSSNPISSIAVDSAHIYAGGQITNKVYKYLKSGLSYISGSGDYDGAMMIGTIRQLTKTTSGTSMTYTRTTPSTIYIGRIWKLQR